MVPSDFVIQQDPPDLAHFFTARSFGAIIQLVPRRPADLYFALESLPTVILTDIAY